MRGIIRLGDPTSHGGMVTSTKAVHVTVDGVAVACVGDICSCPIPGHTGCTIVEGSATHTVAGVPVAYHGHHTSCGAVLNTTIETFQAN
ncbi:MAG: PAAR domain-containing protein [Telluria sp.]|nr:PAAR domain-containing protein [Telluria sp.]